MACSASAWERNEKKTFAFLVFFPTFRVQAKLKNCTRLRSQDAIVRRAQDGRQRRALYWEGLRPPQDAAHVVLQVGIPRRLEAQIIPLLNGHKDPLSLEQNLN